MKQSQFEYDLPADYIAQYPRKDRDASNLMVVDKEDGDIEHKKFKDIVDYFEKDDVLIVNNTRVFPARLEGQKEKTGADIEVFLLRELNTDMRLWDVMVDPARKIRVGNKIFFGGEDVLVAEVIDNTTSRGRTIRFIYEGEDEEFKKILYSLGKTPLPKYIKREPEPIDDERYQTLFARETGAIAAPTAGLHFSKPLIKRLELKGVKIAEVTLHTGLASFNPIDVEDLAKYKMDAEYFKIESDAVEKVNKAKKEGRRVCAVGTTTMRAIESAVTADGYLKEEEGWTNLFIYPPYEFHIANSMITNFHLPRSSLLIMVASFLGYDLTFEAYEEAIEKEYRFFSYGDSMFIK